LKTLAKLALELTHGATTSRALVEQCLQRISASSGEGARAFLKVHAQTARAAADYYDLMRKLGAPVSPWSGIPISIKDLFDIVGGVTTAGSRVLRNQPAANADAPSVARLRAAGFIPIGRTNMTEFAYSGLGINPHYGTPLNAFERAASRIPGGSSSGAAVSITDEMAYGALGTDTGGSCRIPAAFCGIVGFKPTASRIPLEGTFPLSQSLDSVGPLANSVQCCAVLDAILAGEPEVSVESSAVAGLRFRARPERFECRQGPHRGDSAGAVESVAAHQSQGRLSGGRVLRAPREASAYRVRPVRSARVSSHFAREGAERGGLSRPRRGTPRSVRER
jgi:aspartyl-tRNA(Asn)/glutamyl-tRNA(Gln) amidotransferase subunit A